MMNKEKKQQIKSTDEKKKKRNKYTLEELLEKCTPENRHEEIDFGRVGRELL